jgi:hypothetical protein
VAQFEGVAVAAGEDAPVDKAPLPMPVPSVTSRKESGMGRPEK